MPSFRFCRPDDIPELVDAVNRAYLVHFPHCPPMTAMAFKEEVKEINLWASSCMLATEDGVPIGVLIAAKRERVSVILRLGIHPKFQGLGYGSHLLNSLKNKMQVLGPPLLTVELNEADVGMRSFFEKQGYRASGRFVDFESLEPFAQLEMAELIQELDVRGLKDRYLRLPTGSTERKEGSLAWIRQTETLRNRKKQIRGYGIPDLDGIAAYLFLQEAEERRERIVELCALGCRQEVDASLLLRILLGKVSRTYRCKIRIPCLSKQELPHEIIKGLGFEAGRRYVQYRIRTQ